MKKLIITLALFAYSLSMTTVATADVYMSNDVVAQQQIHYDKAQLLAAIDSTEVEKKLRALGVSPEDAKSRIAYMTPEEMATFQHELDNLPAGQGIVGAVVTVLVVIALLDVLGVTDVYPFIRPIN